MGSTSPPLEFWQTLWSQDGRSGAVPVLGGQASKPLLPTSWNSFSGSLEFHKKFNYLETAVMEEYGEYSSQQSLLCSVF